MTDFQKALQEKFPFAEKFEIEFGYYGENGERILWDFNASVYKEGRGSYWVSGWAETLDEAIENAAGQEVQFLPENSF